MSVAPQTRIAPTTPSGDDVEIPALENGDRLTRDEFERRYLAMPHVKKAELIEGVVYMPSPVRLKKHGEPHLDLATWIGFYKALTPGTSGGDNSTARLDLKNESQPDLLLLINPASGGQSKLSGDYIDGAPELVCEIAASSASIDLNDKLEAYRRNGVREYIVWVTPERDVRWNVLTDGRYERMLPDTDGILRSSVFPGLWLDPAALFAGNMARVLEVVRLGTESAEHGQFVRKLAGE